MFLTYSASGRKGGAPESRPAIRISAIVAATTAQATLSVSGQLDPINPASPMGNA